MFSNPQIFPINRLVFLLSVLCFVQAQSPPGQKSTNFKPNLEVVIGIMAIMFSLTSILVVYAKFCHGPQNDRRNNDHVAVNNIHQIPNVFVRQNSLYRGVDKNVIESIPFFRFSSLRGSRRGLECVVCLSKFEDVEILRLLPKCKHAFHIACIDEWLEKHSSCPLCRVKIDEQDLATLTYTDSMRHLSSQADQVVEDPSMELYVQREDSNLNRSWSSRFNFRNSLRKSGNDVMKQEELPIQENDDVLGKKDNSMHKFNHKIIVSDIVVRKRWSSLSSLDLMKLNSEMLGDVSSSRFSCLDTNTTQESFTRQETTEEGGISEIEEEMERKMDFEHKVGKLNRINSFPSSSEASSSNRSIILNANGKRSMSEITVFSRFKRNNSLRESPFAQNGGKEGRLKRLWLPIAQRTAQRYADRGKKSQQSDNMRESLNV